MFDPKKLLTDLLDSRMPGTDGTVRDKARQAGELARHNPIATGAIAAILFGTSTGRSITGSALKLGGLAAVAGLAYKAFQNYQDGKSPEQSRTEASGEQKILPPPADTAFDTASAPQGEDEFALALVRAMIAGARADGHIDDEEREQIAERLAMAGLEHDAAEFIDRELAAPLDLDAIVAAAKTDAQKVELYTASRLTIRPDSRAERGYLDMLAGRLGLPDALIDHVEATIEGATA
ncbi:tellurite resistance TerB family protein [Oricola thermophila]|uniref:Tellurite resistance TerB family protein n=1 Tax=Oricola thermophila TaxID=2742145 RepID=A0A6N1VHP8_9HYPH|nr:tellurite resistance TerB family protein [Oricola thermophila]QKV20338.1 tellurite resistance TerB family protein [Oricola thermophila]